MAKAQTIAAQVYLEDEAPRIGCGWRTLNVTVGRKWIYLQERATGTRARLPIRLLDKLKPLPIRPRRRI